MPPQNGIQSPVRLTRETSPFPTSDRSRNQTPPKLGPGVSGIAGHADIAHGTEEASVDNATELEKRNVAETADLMDISDSSAEEGEITDVERQDSSTDEQAKAGARESIPNRLPVSPTEDATESSSQSSDTSVKDKDNYAPDPARVGSDDALKQRQQSTESGTPEVASIVSGLATEREEGQMDSRSVSMDDSDDYEPPEVTPPLTQVEASTPPPLSSPASASPFVRLGNNPVVLSDPPVQTNSIVSEPNQTAFPLTTFDRAIPQAVSSNRQRCG